MEKEKAEIANLVARYDRVQSLMKYVNNDTLKESYKKQPKGNGKMRGLGIPSFEDKVVQGRRRKRSDGGIVFHSVFLVVGMERQNGKHPVHGRRLFPESER